MTRATSWSLREAIATSEFAHILDRERNPFGLVLYNLCPRPGANRYLRAMAPRAAGQTATLLRFLPICAPRVVLLCR